jgi:hypothetical protein
MVMAVIYALPVGLGYSEWFSFYSYLDLHSAQPYIDVREGYPPLGFLIYMPLYYVFHDNVEAFNYAFRALNGAFLVLTLFVLYLILRSAFKEGRAIKLTIYYAALPSVIIANIYSNDVVALLAAALAIYMMTRGKALFCGLFIGVAALCKGFPFLLLIPALFAFTDAYDKVKVAVSAIITILIVSLPFMLANPYTYISTFTHVGSRGPWETVWALIDGYYSHGGLLHPYFDKFFYHSNLLKIYEANHYDHAIYEWNFDWMPMLLTACQLAVIILVSLGFIRRKREIYVFSGMLYIGYMLFFKGYSTQFAVSTPFYMLLATVNTPLPFLVPLELSHILQMFAWGSNIIAPEFLRDWHLHMLVSSILIRTAVFGWLLLSQFRGRFTVKSEIKPLIGKIFSYAKVFSDKKLFFLAFLTALFGALSFGMLFLNLENNLSFNSYHGYVTVSQSVWQNITLNGLSKGDQVALKLKTNTWVEVDAVPYDLKTPIERGVRNPFNLKGSFNETVIFFVAESESYTLMLKTVYPAIPFRVTDGLDGDLKVEATFDSSTLVLKLRDEGLDGKDSMFRIAYPLDVYAAEDFSLNLRYKILEGRVSRFFLDVFDDNDEWIYAFNITENFVLKAKSKDLYGYSNLYGDHLSLFALSIFIEDGASTVVKLEEISVINGGKNYNLKFYCSESQEVSYEIFIEKEWKPATYYISAFIIFVMASIAAFALLYKKTKSYICF